MAEPGYPQDHKDPSVFVDMSSHSHEDDNDLSNSAPPPPFSDHADEDAVPLLSAADEKEALDQKNASAVPIPEDQNQNQQQKVCGRRWGRRCNRTPEQRAACKAKARKLFRRIFAIGLLFWVYCAFFTSDYDFEDYSFDDDNEYIYVEGGSPTLMPLSAHHQSNLTPKQQADLVFAMSEDECMKNLIPWDGPQSIMSYARDIKLSVGKGNIFTNVVVRSSLFVDSPTLRITANVTKNIPEDGGDDDGDDDDDDDEDEDDRQKEGPKGLHLEVKDEEDRLEVIFWADGHLDEPADEPEEPEEPEEPVPSPPPHHRHGHKHHKKHHKKHHHGKKHHGMKHHRKHHERKHRHDEDNESFWMKKRALHSRRFDDDEESSGRPKGQKFCASIDIEILLPFDYNGVDRLSVNGVVLRATVEDDLAPIFGEGIDNLEINAVVGEIKTGAVRANTLKANVVAGHIHIGNVRAATPGTPVHARVSSVAANITLGVTTTTIDKPEEDDGDDDGDDGGEDVKSGCSGKRGGDGDGDDDGDDDEPRRRHSHHLVKATATAGNIHIKITEGDDDWIDKLKHNAEQIPGVLAVRSGTGAGNIHSYIDLIDDRLLSLKSESVGGEIYSRVSDKFLGSFKVGSFFGTAEVIEVEDSPSTIDYSKNQKNAKVGRKIIVRDGDDDDDDDDNSVLGDIVLGSPFGRSTLEFF